MAGGAFSFPPRTMPKMMLALTTASSAAKLDLRFIGLLPLSRRIIRAPTDRDSAGEVRRLRPVGRQKLRHHGAERADIDRLLENLIDTQVTRLLPDGVVQKRRDQDAPRAELAAPKLGEQAQTVHLGHLVVDE